MEKVESNPVFCSGEAWKTNELILDAILKYLTVQEVKIFRLVSKSFSVAGARPLLRKTLIRLTAIVNLKPVSEKVPVLTAHNSPDSDFWQCECLMDSGRFEYSHIDAYSEYLESSAFYSAFAPKNLSVATSFDVWKLPLPHFCSLESLKVVTFRPSQGLKLLNEFHLLFPNLKSLQLRYIQPETEVTEAAKSMESSKIADDTKGSSEILLENLEITVSSDWKYIGPEVFHRFRNLKALKLYWSGRYPPNAWGRHSPPLLAQGFLNRFNFDSVQYVDWLLGPKFPAKYSLLTDLSLRLDLLPSTSAAAREVLNSMKLKKLSLDLYGNLSEFSEFILGLCSSAIAALDSIHSACSCLDGPADEIHPSIVWLGDNGFFGKPKWELTFRLLSVTPGLCSFVRSESQFRLHISRCLLHSFTLELPNIVLKYLEGAFSSYNYSYRRFRLNKTVVRYAYERITPENVFHFPRQPHCKAYVGIRHRDTNNGRPTHTMDCDCSTLCKKPSLLLCEIPGFLEEAVLDSSADCADHPNSSIETIFVMCHVKPDILKKVRNKIKVSVTLSVVDGHPRFEAQCLGREESRRSSRSNLDE